MKNRYRILLALLFAAMSHNLLAATDQADQLRYLIESSLRPTVSPARQTITNASTEATDEAAHQGASLPEDTIILHLETDADKAYVCLKVNPEFLRDDFDDLALEHLGHQMENWLQSLHGITEFQLQLSPSDVEACRDAPSFLNTLVDEPEKDPDASVTPDSDAGLWLPQTLSPARGQAQPSGALSGASIFLSPGHGWYYNSSLGRYATQRGNTHNLIEDFSNAEAVLQYLVPYLWNAGARVYTTRERDLNTNMVIMDNQDPDVIYDGDGWINIDNNLNWQGDHREVATTTGSATAKATFTPDIPESGHYGVYVWYGRASDGDTHRSARFTVKHQGGATEWNQDLTKDGNTWKYIGQYYFEAGRHSDAGSVVIDNSGGTGGETLVVDAVRFGGGMGDILDPDSGTTSQKPRWEESGKYYAGFLGKSNWASANTVNAMPRWAAWENESWEQGKSVYVAWHTNAPEGGLGTSSYAYSSSGFNGPFNGVEGGLALRDIIYNELINDIRAGYDPDWTARGRFTNWFGEVNPGHNPEMPAALFEIAFHATAADANALKDPRFRQLTARAMYQGLVKFYNTEMSGFSNDTLLPETPVGLSVVEDTSGVLVRWQAPPSDSGDGLLGDVATAYKVYLSDNGKGFDNGTTVNGNSFRLENLANNEVTYIRVTALNAGGESFPTETLAIRPGDNAAKALIVNGFDRISGSQNIIEDDPNDSASLHRGYLSRMNSFDYAISHAESLHNKGIVFDSTSNEAILDGSVDLQDYDAIVWILGEESTADDTFDQEEQSQISAYLDAGGNLFLSGSEIGWDLGRNAGSDKNFYNDYLHAEYIADDASSYQVQGTPGNLFADIELTFDNGSSIYDVDYPDIITGYSNSNVVMNYLGGSGGGAAIAHHDSLSGHRVVMLAFPFETILEKNARDQIVSASFDFFCKGRPALCNSPADTADISVMLKGDDGKADEAGDSFRIQYQVIVTNHGDSDATNIEVSNRYPDNTSIISLTPQTAICNNDTRCQIDHLAPGTSETITVQVQRPEKAKADYSASVSATEPDPDLENNQADASFGGAIYLLLPGLLLLSVRRRPAMYQLLTVKPDTLSKIHTDSLTSPSQNGTLLNQPPRKWFSELNHVYK